MHVDPRSSVRLALSWSLGLTLMACSPTSANPAGPGATLLNAAGQTVGSASFLDTPDGARIEVRVRGLSAGMHGMHVHTNPSCADSTDASGNAVRFGGAGPHFDPKGTMKHGGPSTTENEAHAGDVMNLEVDASGVGRMAMTTRKLTAGAGPLSVVGRSIIVHANPDNYTDTPPLGGSGGRVACGVITQP